ncbi:MAG: esterase [Rhodobacterales bacterium]|nr:MAG: esterase [Rhodobacterales bacterium]
MTHFLLIHGSNHGAWAWSRLIPELEARGARATAIDLPGQGADDTPLAEVDLAAYGRAVAGALTEPSVIVAHSAGGFAAAEAAAQGAANIEKIIYLCAYRPAPGASLLDMLKDAPSQPLARAITLSDDKKSFFFNDEAITDLLFPEGNAEDHDFIRRHIGAQPMRPQAQPVSGPVPEIEAHYILCENDRIIPPEHQEMMAAGLPETHIHRRPWGHSPYLQAPEALTELLLSIAD